MLFINGRRDSGVSDLRERIDRSYSPKRGYSPARDARGRHTLREYSPSRSLEKESKRRKRQHLDDHSDYSGSLRTPNEPEDEAKEARSVFQKQIQVVQSELKMVEQRRSQLEVYLGERSQEVGSLTSKIQELEAQLYKEKEDCKRISHKVKKFVKAHSHHSRIQDQLKRSQVRLNKLGDQLGLDTYVTDANEEDASINIVSDGETDFPAPLHKKRMIDVSPIKKRLNLNRDPALEPKAAHSTRRPQRLSRWNINPAQSNFVNGNDAMNNGIGSPRLLAKDSKLDRRKAALPSVVYADVSKNSESGPAVPSTSMAAHAVDTEIDIELDGKLENVDIASRRIEEEPTYESGIFSLPLPPPPPFPPKNFSQHEGNDEIVDIVDGVE
uniref:zinc finger CCCH domain-containing protein 13 isoform X2 n=1 Tax=Fragaria vesca subsp. vesca TaxID=101020 RepID=UPI0005CA8D5C|nr:PREDICTED: zinc finger CCCH domain-containing protein 13 isoform X2 [Fragaria vesca subsp. vesca]XP_011463136.1 PREDICTED: zinc finger CCCH domain-containing protein 13 isoform X2 [Fragaria vesca subsp. vesca]XP_011463137.1 PREDICTED: zinc finger CCCH domain-containing protein 13 isoform X2 [Fragaria vesca subsp. vesca]XP_011463141.1 PREDICTED: zinc finger CCCH domain-containing protein 13 isoform X2 [Fragaria vesca subsp. vesca]